LFIFLLSLSAFENEKSAIDFSRYSAEKKFLFTASAGWIQKETKSVTCEKCINNEDNTTPEEIVNAAKMFQKQTVTLTSALRAFPI
jgi:hypothetical protein